MYGTVVNDMHPVLTERERLQNLADENAKLRKENDTLCRRIDELCMEVESLRRDQGEWDGDTLVLTLKRDPSSIHVRMFAGRLAPRRVYKAEADLLAERTAKRIVVSDGGVGHAECSACGSAIDQDDAWCRHCGARMEGE